MQCGYVHAAHGKKRNQGHLGPHLQLQIPDQNSRHESECQIGNDTESTIEIAERLDDGVINASPGLSFIPEVAYWIALKEGNKEECQASHNRDEHGRVNDQYVYPLDGDPE
jgi:hypothetical protein